MHASQPLWSHRLAIFALAWLLANLTNAAQSIKYCSSLNTGDGDGTYDIWQSYGACTQTCSGYAFAVLQINECWCTNYIPGVKTDVSDCYTSCPGYNEDMCASFGLYAYYQIGNPSGTKDANSASSTHSPVRNGDGAASSCSDRDCLCHSLNYYPPPITSASADSSVLSTSTSAKPTSATTPPPTSNSDDDSTWTPTTFLSLETVTGQVRTVTVIPTGPANANSKTTIESSKNKEGLSSGAAAGIAIAVIAIVGAIVGVIVWFCLRKRRQEKEENEKLEEERRAEESQRSSSSGLKSGTANGITRSMSENSRFVLGSNGKMVVGAFEPEEVGTASSRLSTHGLKPVDPRLDPFGAAYANQSRESVNTINDAHDYSRKILRTTNPDPDDD
ncbi:hypothetical protein B0O99DRAFT_655140 [Bisporella sp. PMI_857]|nr:hypothetical protein B0O99DRAFT_655140 [Bisporella sp. PMI_857]